MKLPSFFFDIKLSSYVLWKSFCQDPLENWFGRQRCLGSRKDNRSMVDFGYNINAIRNQKHLKPITNGNVSDSGLIASTEEPFPCRKHVEKVNNLLNLSMLFIFIFISTLTNIRQINLLSCYNNGRIFICRYQGVILRNNDMLFWEFFVNLSVIIRPRLWFLA